MVASKHLFESVCMTLPGGGLRLQTLGGLASQLFDSTLRTCCIDSVEYSIMIVFYFKYVPFSLQTLGISLK